MRAIIAARILIAIIDVTMALNIGIAPRTAAFLEHFDVTRFTFRDFIRFRNAYFTGGLQFVREHWGIIVFRPIRNEST